jgi:adenine-specific DNA-methyltransferase
MIYPEEKELPSHFALRLAKLFSKKTSQQHKKDLGQFFTPLEIADLMASMAIKPKKNISVLDPGCGTAVLSCALIQELVKHNVRCINLSVYEIDLELNNYITASLSYLQSWLTDKKIKLRVKYLKSDFIVSNYSVLTNNLSGTFDFIISNPPYFKISKEDSRKVLLKHLSSGQMNMYAAFAAISANLLCKKGQIILIIPRSFASGEYFKGFRNLFFSKVQLEKIHLFISRKEAFSDDNVLQENIIIKASRTVRIDTRKHITISQSNGIKDISKSTKNNFPYRQLIDIYSPEKYLYLPVSLDQHKIMEQIQLQKNTLASLGYKVSTGPVVYFRKTEFLKKANNAGCVPLIWLNNISKYNISHPLNGKSKEQFIQHSDRSDSILIDNTNMILVRRFTTKEDSSRIVAASHLKKNMIEYPKLGIENKLNYIVKTSGKLTDEETLAITAILNSAIYNEYFRIFNGNTQVSATELKKMPFPDTLTLRSIGKKIKSLRIKNDKKIDNIVIKAIFGKFSNY